MKDFLKTFNILTDKEIDKFIQLSTAKKLNKGDFFIYNGNVCKEVAFVSSGILRSFYNSSSDEEITYCITFPNNLITAYSSYITEQKTPENIQALTSVDLLVARKEELEKMTHESFNWMRFMKTIAEQQYIELENRIFQLQKENAKQRYINLIKNHPKYIQNIPLQYLASYLGITQRHLSRLRKEIAF